MEENAPETPEQPDIGGTPGEDQPSEPDIGGPTTPDEGGGDSGDDTGTEEDAPDSDA